MKKALFGSVIACLLLTCSAYGAEMITNEDLERKYPSEEEPADRPEEKAGRWIYERSRVENECAQLKAAVEQARRAAYDESDRYNQNDRKAYYMRIKQQYLSNCNNR